MKDKKSWQQMVDEVASVYGHETAWRLKELLDMDRFQDAEQLIKLLDVEDNDGKN
jgi:hypothetical protein